MSNFEGFPGECYPGCCHLHRACQEEDCDCHGCGVCPEEAGQDPVWFWRIVACLHLWSADESLCSPPWRLSFNSPFADFLSSLESCHPRLLERLLPSLAKLPRPSPRVTRRRGRARGRSLTPSTSTRWDCLHWLHKSALNVIIWTWCRCWSKCTLTLGCLPRPCRSWTRSWMTCSRGLRRRPVSWLTTTRGEFTFCSVAHCGTNYSSPGPP